MPEGLCPRCLIQQALEGPDAFPHGDDLWSDVAGDLPRTLRRFGPYELIQELGRGGMGVVYKARHRAMGRLVALKTLRIGTLADDEDLSRFRNEVESISQLDHPAIVPVYEAGEHEGQQFFTMKLVEGGSLEQRLGRYLGDHRAIATLAVELSEAVHHAHMRGVLHRDLKPANILVDDDDRAYVGDFGLAKRMVDDPSTTLSGSILGTPAYMSPEQVEGHRAGVTTATDVYGLGTILYALLTGRAPFAGTSAVETLDAVRKARPEPPRSIDRAVPRDLETITLRCLEKDPARRYRSVQSLTDDLRAWLGSRPISARRVRPPERAWLWCRRHPAQAFFTAVATLAVLSGVVGMITIQSRANAELRAASARERQQFALAMGAIRSLGAEVGDDALLRDPRLKPLRDRVLGETAALYAELERLLQGQHDPASRRDLANAYFDLGSLTSRIGDRRRARQAHEKGLELRRNLAAEAPDRASTLDLGNSLIVLGDLEIDAGRLDTSRAYLDEAERALSKLLSNTTSDAATRLLLARVASVQGMLRLRNADYEGAMQALQRGLECLPPANTPGIDSDALRRCEASLHGRISSVYLRTNRHLEAEAPAIRAIEILRSLADAAPDRLDVRAEAVPFLYNMASILGKKGEAHKASQALRLVILQCRDIVEQNPATTEYRRLLATYLVDLGNQLLEIEDRQGALDAFRESLSRWEDLASDFPDEADKQLGLARACNQLSHRARDVDEAIELRIRAVNAQRLGIDAGDVRPHKFLDLGWFELELAMVLREGRRSREDTRSPARAIDAMARAIELEPSLLAEIPQLEFALEQARLSARDSDSLAILAGPLERLGMAVRNAAAAQINNPQYRLRISVVDNAIGDWLQDQRRFDEALASHHEARDLLDKLLVDSLAPGEVRAALARSQLGIARVHWALDEIASAQDAARKSLAYDQELSAATMDGRVRAAVAHAILATTSPTHPSADPAEPERHALQALESLRQAVELGYYEFSSLIQEGPLARLATRPDFPSFARKPSPADPSQ